jgi:uncharacterized repeat protein (TIGR01451 family)
MRRSNTRRLVIVIAAALLAFAFMPVGLQPARAHDVDDHPTIASNPDLPDQCGIDVILLMDSSGSITPSGADDIAEAYFAFLEGLSGSGARAAVIDFDDTASLELGYTTVTEDSIYDNDGPGGTLGDFEAYMDGFTANGLTNWEDAFLVAETLATADLVVLITDGDPTTWVNPPAFPPPNLGDIPDIALTEAVVAANTLKGEGAHILAVGVGTAPTLDNLKHVSGNDVHPPSDLNKDTVNGIDVILASFADLANVLGGWAEALCADIELTKTGSFTDGNGSAVGDEITYTFTIKNTGTVPLSSVSLTDAKLSLSDYTCTTTSLDANDESPGGTDETTCEVTYAIDQDDLDAGSVYNEATVAGEAPLGTPVSDTDDETVDLLQQPDIEIVKTGSITSGDGSSVGDTITYNFTVTNTGNVTLDPVGVTDPLDGLSAISCPKTALDPDESMTCSATYDIDQDDIDAGDVDNEATATGTPPSGPDVDDEDTETVNLSQDPSLSVEKELTDHDDADSDGLVSLGETLTFTITATNDGNVTLSDVVVTDDLITPTGGTTPCASVAPGGTCTLVGTYVVTAGDVTAGEVENTGTACADTDGPPCDDDTVTTPVEDPSIEITKGPDNQFVDQGQSFTWTITVTNTGNVDLTSVEVDDPLVPACDKTIGALAKGASTNYTCTVDDVQQLIANVAYVMGYYTTVKVEDDDPSDLFVIAAAAAVGDTVWLDENGDGVEDPDEPGVPNADVMLYQCLDLVTDPDCDTLNVLIGTTTTDADGHYEFVGLEVGDYLVVIDTGTVDGDLTTAGSFLVPLGSNEEFLDADFGVEEVLPVTGLDTGEMGWFGLALLALGGMLTLGSGIRRREQE